MIQRFPLWPRNCLGIILMFVVAGCSTYGTPNRPREMSSSHLKVESPRPEELSGINSLLVIPLIIGGDQNDLSQEEVFREFSESLSKELSIELRFSEALAREFAKISIAEAERRAVELGRKEELDGVIFGELLKLYERKGSKFAGDAGATVAFSVRLIRTTDGREIWKGDFYRKDVPLSENLFRLREVLREGPAYRSADQILAEGFALVGKDIAMKRAEHYLSR